MYRTPLTNNCMRLYPSGSVASSSVAPTTPETARDIFNYDAITAGQVLACSLGKGACQRIASPPAA